MKEEILRLIYDYSNANKLADKAFIDKVIYLYNSNYGLDNYFKNIKYLSYDEENKKSNAGYSYQLKTIFIFFDKIIDSVFNTDKYVYDIIPKNKACFYRNVEITQTLLHEIEHVIQSKKMDYEKSDEAEILKITGVSKSKEFISDRLTKLGYDKDIIKVFLDNKMKIYHRNYDYAPNERLAEINAYRNVLDIIAPIREYIPAVFRIEEMKLYKIELKGYTLNKKIISPTIHYLQQQGENNQLEKFDWYDSNPLVALEKSRNKYNLEKRIKLGLPISVGEYKEKDKTRLLTRY